MTEREKMIEEMANDIHNAKKLSDYHCYEDEYTDCKKCKLYKYAENKMCQDAYEACSLIEDGWCKISEGAVLLTKEEYEKFRMYEKQVYYMKNIYSDKLVPTAEGIANEVKQACKETARQSCDDLIKIIKIIKNNADSNASTFGWTTEFILNIIKTYFKEKFGVEV